jgi:hypothetical protein
LCGVDRAGKRTLRKYLRYIWWGVLACGAAFVLIWRALQRANSIGRAEGREAEAKDRIDRLPKDALDEELKRKLRELR